MQVLLKSHFYVLHYDKVCSCILQVKLICSQLNAVICEINEEAFFEFSTDIVLIKAKHRLASEFIKRTSKRKKKKVLLHNFVILVTMSPNNFA